MGFHFMANRSTFIYSYCNSCLPFTFSVPPWLARHVVSQAQAPASATNDCPKLCAGYSPTLSGSCWCGLDTYCMCTPSLAIDTVVEITSPATGEVIRLSCVSCLVLFLCGPIETDACLFWLARRWFAILTVMNHRNSCWHDSVESRLVETSRQ